MHPEIHPGDVTAPQRHLQKQSHRDGINHVRQQVSVLRGDDFQLGDDGSYLPLCGFAPAMSPKSQESDSVTVNGAMDDYARDTSCRVPLGKNNNPTIRYLVFGGTAGAAASSDPARCSRCPGPNAIAYHYFVEDKYIGDLYLELNRNVVAFWRNNLLESTPWHGEWCLVNDYTGLKIVFDPDAIEEWPDECA